MVSILWSKIQIAITALGGWLGYFLGGIADEPAVAPVSEEKPAGSTVEIFAENGGSVKIRVGNSTDFKSITTVNPGATFDYVATAANGWNAIVVGKQVGWVSGKYSKVI